MEERTGHKFGNNLCYADKNEFPLLVVWQPEFMCDRLKAPALNKLNNNVYVNNSSQADIVIHQKTEEGCITEGKTPGDVNQIFNDYSAESKSYKSYNGWLFKGVYTGNFQLLKDFPGNQAADVWPDEIQKLIGNKKTKPYIGAYPLQD